jgi:hypothetical protein
MRGVELCRSLRAPKALLKPSFCTFEPVQCIEQLKTGLAHLVRVRRELLGLPDCESDSINRDPDLICEFVFKRAGPGLSIGFDHL